MVRRRLLTPRTGPSGRAANLHKLPPGTQRECPHSQLRSPHGVEGGGGGAQNEEPLPSLILGKSSRGQRLPSPPPEPPCGFGVKVEATSHHKNGGTCSIHGGGGGGGGHLGNVPREAPAVLPAASRVVPWALEA